MSIKKQRATLSTIHVLESRQQRKYKKHASALSRSRRLFLIVVAVILFILLVGIIAGGIYGAFMLRDLPALEQIGQKLQPEPGITVPATQFFDRSGDVLLYTLENPGVPRRYLSINPGETPHFSPQIVQVITSLEDGFWSGPGISLQKFTQPQPLTITEHLVDEFLLHDEPPGLQRTIEMRVLAVQIQARFGKAKVLEWYLNSAYFGHLAFGADQASWFYFGKSAAQLNLAESALLTSLLTTPSLNPLDAPQAAIERMHSILDQLAATGSYSSADIENAKDTQIVIVKSNDEQEKMSEFIQYSIQQLETRIDTRVLERGGLKVITSLDTDLQQQMICTIQTQLQRVAQPSDGQGVDAAESCESAALLPSFDNELAGIDISISDVGANGLVLDPLNAEILAWSGVISNGNKLIPTGYQAGSLLTPFTAAAAYASGMTPATLVWDVPEAGTESNLNPDRSWHGPQSLHRVLANGYLDAIYQTANRVGFDNVWKLTKTLGLIGLEQSAFAEDLARGGGNTSLTEIAQAYSTFATLGQQTGIPDNQDGTFSPITVLSVEDLAGNILYRHEDAQTRALLDPGLAYLVHDVLSDTTSEESQVSGLEEPQNPGASISLDIGRPAAAVIGSAAGGRQAWTVGYTPRHLVVVWMGLAEERLGNDVLSLPAALPAGIWQAVIRFAAQNEPTQDWEKPDNIVQKTVCHPSGQLPTQVCPDQVDEFFLSGSEPMTADTLYQTFRINQKSGKLATVFTLRELVDQRTFFVVPAEYKDWALRSEIAQPPTEYDPIPVQQNIPGVEITSPMALTYIHGEIQIIGSAEGADFISYRLDSGRGLNPLNWIQIGGEHPEPVKNASLGVWDTNGLNGLYIIRLEVLRSENRQDTTYVDIMVDNTPPQAAITWPQDKQAIEYEEGKQIVLLADISDTVGVDHIAWFVDGVAIGEKFTAPWFFPWQMSKGSHILKVEAFDLAGNVTGSPEVEINVQ